jgi:hypothetical protein
MPRRAAAFVSSDNIRVKWTLNTDCRTDFIQIPAFFTIQAGIVSRQLAYFRSPKLRRFPLCAVPPIRLFRHFTTFLLRAIALKRILLRERNWICPFPIPFYIG